MNINRDINNYISKDTRRTGISISQKEKKNNNSSQINFSAINLNNIADKPGLFKRAGLFLERNCKNFLEGDSNPYVLDIVNFGSKIIISPLMILAIAPFTRDWNKDKDAIKASAILHPIQAALTLTFAIVSSLITNKVIDKFARKGTLCKPIDPEFAHMFDPIRNKEFGAENLGKLKKLNTVAFTLLMIPVAGKILDSILPRILKDDKHIKSSDRVLDSIYARKLYVPFGKTVNDNNEVKPNKLYA